MSERRRYGRFDLAATMRELASPVALDPELEPEETARPGRPPLLHVALVFLGGFLGTLARYGVVDGHPSPAHGVDLAVLLINASGAFVLGLLGTTLFVRRPSWVGLRLAITTGLLGGWTTYSAIIAGALVLAHNRAPAAGLGTLGLELIVPVLGAGLGLLLGALFEGARR